MSLRKGYEHGYVACRHRKLIARYLLTVYSDGSEFITCVRSVFDGDRITDTGSLEHTVSRSACCVINGNIELALAESDLNLGIVFRHLKSISGDIGAVYRDGNKIIACSRSSRNGNHSTCFCRSLGKRDRTFTCYVRDLY